MLSSERAVRPLYPKAPPQASSAFRSVRCENIPNIAPHIAAYIRRMGMVCLRFTFGASTLTWTRSSIQRRSSTNKVCIKLLTPWRSKAWRNLEQIFLRRSDQFRRQRASWALFALSLVTSEGPLQTSSNAVRQVREQYSVWTLVQTEVLEGKPESIDNRGRPS